MLFICHPTCTTCDKARKFLSDNKLSYTERDIRAENPSVSELNEWVKANRLPLKRFFNTSGNKYRELGLTKKLPNMSEEDQLQVLAGDGMLVKRPLLITDKFVLVGFNEKTWAAALKG